MYFEKIVEIVTNHLALDEETAKQLTPGSSMKEMKIDSLDIVEIIMKIEDEFEIEIPDEKLKEFQNLGDIAKYIQQIKES
ncbi:acyl carrier protein [bacterium]|nr:acyl carrier protein [bacterium]MBR6244928.1 acyl carrier protein [bacterium]